MATGRLDPRPAPAAAPGTAGRTLFAFRAPVRLRPGEAVTLRYAYGAAQPRAVPRLVRRWRAARRPLARSQAEWARWLPRSSFGPGRAWLARELKWAAYTLRSGTSYEECAGRHVISQGGYYQYGNFGAQIAYRDPLQHMLPMVYAAPAIARDVLLYSARQQPRTGDIAYGTESLCRPAELEPSNDMDLWLLWSAAEYGLATRDLGVFRARVPFRDGGSATLWRAPEARVRPPGVPGRPERRIPHDLHGRLVGLLGGLPRDDRVHARLRSARLRLPAAGGAGGRAW